MTTVRTLVQERRMLRGEACAEGRYQSQIKELHGCFQRAMFERDSKVVAHARHDLLAEQEAMNLRLQQHTLHMQSQIAQAGKTVKEAIS